MVDFITWCQKLTYIHAMEYLKPPGHMNFGTSNVAETWDQWSARFENYFVAAELSKKDEGTGSHTDGVSRT